MTPTGHHGYRVPKHDFKSIAGAIEALKSPNYAVRYLAWTTLHERGLAAEAGLSKLWRSSNNSRYRARALWLLAKLPGRAAHYTAAAIADDDANMRIIAVRIAQQLDEVELAGVIGKLLSDPNAQVRRECLVYLNEVDGPRAAKIWSELALGYDGKDRWYLEALGIGAAGRSD